MTPEQALQLLAQVTETINTSRANHAQIMKALDVLKMAITPKPQAPKEQVPGSEGPKKKD